MPYLAQAVGWNVAGLPITTIVSAVVFFVGLLGIITNERVRNFLVSNRGISGLVAIIAMLVFLGIMGKQVVVSQTFVDILNMVITMFVYPLATVAVLYLVFEFGKGILKPLLKRE